MFQKLFLNLLLLVNGVRFYKTNVTPVSPSFRVAEFTTDTNAKLQFVFYKEIFEDMIYRAGTIQTKRYRGYIIQAKFTDNLPDSLLQYDNLKFFFDDSHWKNKDEKLLTDTLLNIFIDFLERDLQRV